LDHFDALQVIDKRLYKRGLALTKAPSRGSFKKYKRKVQQSMCENSTKSNATAAESHMLDPVCTQNADQFNAPKKNRKSIISLTRYRLEALGAFKLHQPSDFIKAGRSTHALNQVHTDGYCTNKPGAGRIQLATLATHTSATVKRSAAKCAWP
jgi:hypothetical protein